MSKSSNVKPCAAALYFISVQMRMPLKFGPETVSSVTCARVRLTVRASRGRQAEGWGETPLMATWAWQGNLSYEERHGAMKDFCVELVQAWGTFGERGHALEIGHAFLERKLPALLDDFNRRRAGAEPMPWLAALICCSAFDIALHDAYGCVNNTPVYQTYNAEWMNKDLAHYLVSAEGSDVSFAGKYPADFITARRSDRIPVWHLVGGKDPIEADELTGREPDDGYPVLLRDWIKRDGLKCLKIKLRGNDADWDFERVVKVGRIAIEEDVDWLTVDFNCTVREPAYVNGILDRLVREQPRMYGMILYVEQPFPYELESNRIDVHSVAARKPLFMDESAHDWKLVMLGRRLGWTGVALKTCKTQTGALLSLCWARAHGMTLMVQDLTNPMLAQVPHCLLAAHAGTIMGVESNGPQFYPEASKPEAGIHPGLYTRRNGNFDLSTLSGPGFGYRINEIERQLPVAVAECG